MEKQTNCFIAFLDVFISDTNNQNLTPQAFYKSTYTGLLLNFKSFTSFSCKISLINCLVDRSFKICNNWNSFHNDIESIKSNLIRNAYPPFLMDTVIKKYLIYKFPSNQNQLKDTSDVHYFKLPYINNLLQHIKNKRLKLSKEWNLLVLAVVLAKLAKLVVILKVGLRNISKRITSLIFLNIYTQPQHGLTHVILFLLK